MDDKEFVTASRKLVDDAILLQAEASKRGKKDVVQACAALVVALVMDSMPMTT